jgi:hypothetical protein
MFLMPWFDGAILSKGVEGNTIGQVRHDYARRQSGNTAIASFSLAAVPRTVHQTEDDGEVAQARDGRGHERRADGTVLHVADLS